MHGCCVPQSKLGKFDGGVTTLQTGELFGFDCEEYAGNIHRVYLTCSDVFSYLKIGDLLHIDGDRIQLQVQLCGKSYAECIVLKGGEISDGLDVKIVKPANA